LKAGVSAAFGPEPVLTMAWLHPARVTAAKQARPSLMTAQSDLPKGAMGQLQLFEDAWHPLADEGDAVTTGRLRQRS